MRDLRWVLIPAGVAVAAVAAGWWLRVLTPARLWSAWLLAVGAGGLAVGCAAPWWYLSDAGMWANASVSWRRIALLVAAAAGTMGWGLTVGWLALGAR